jgi:hypothetical protein
VSEGNLNFQYFRVKQFGNTVRKRGADIFATATEWFLGYVKPATNEEKLSASWFIFQN